MMSGSTARDNHSLGVMTKPRPQEAMQTPEKRDGSFCAIPVSAVEKHSSLDSVRNNPGVRKVFVDLHFYYTNALKPAKKKDSANFMACSDCDKGGPLLDNPLEANMEKNGLNTLINLHNKQSPQCTPKIMPVMLYPPSSLYMSSPQAAQGTLYHQNPSAMPMSESSLTQPPFHGIPPTKHFYRP